MNTWLTLWSKTTTNVFTHEQPKQNTVRNIKQRLLQSQQYYTPSVKQNNSKTHTRLVTKEGDKKLEK